MKGTIRARWDTYREMVLHADALPGQVKDTRRAFYAGAWACFTLMMASVEPGHEEPTDDELARFTRLEAEMRAFAKDVEEGGA